MGNTGYEKKGRRAPPWSDLPIELVELILKKCNFSDQACLRAVCRRWQSIPRVQPIKQLPWLMAYDSRNWSRCKLFDLTYNRTYTVNISVMREYYREQKPDFIRICASKSGWLLLSHLIPQGLHLAFFLYSPFTNRIIELPHMATRCYWGSASFSADPTSADCVFFVLHSSIDTRTTVASTCRLGDTTWTTNVFPGHFFILDTRLFPGLFFSISNVVYSEGHFWCVTPFGTLGTFSVAQGTWNVFELSYPRMISDQRKTYLVESNGDILLVLLSHEDNERDVFKLARSQMVWIWVKDIGDQTIFLGSTPFSVSAVPANLGVTGRVHCCWDCESTFHSEHYGLPTIEEHLCKIWIEPPS